MKCQYCNKESKNLNACNLTNMFLCDKCYGDTLNPYNLKKNQTESERIKEIEKLTNIIALVTIYNI